MADGPASIERLRGERDALKAQIAAMEAAIPPDQAATKLMETMAAAKVDPFNAPDQNEWVSPSGQEGGGCCVVM